MKETGQSESENWKLVAKGANGEWELYDLDADRSELNDLRETHPERTSQMAEKWEAWAIEANAKPWPWNRNKKNLGSKKKTFNLNARCQPDQGTIPDDKQKSLLKLKFISKSREKVFWLPRGEILMDGFYL